MDATNLFRCGSWDMKEVLEEYKRLRTTYGWFWPLFWAPWNVRHYINLDTDTPNYRIPRLTIFELITGKRKK